jgi:hypothetical protein
MTWQSFKKKYIKLGKPAEKGFQINQKEAQQQNYEILDKISQSG